MISLSIMALTEHLFFYLRFISLTSEVTNTVRPVVLPVVHQLLFNSSSDP